MTKKDETEELKELNFEETELAPEPDDFEELNRNEALDYLEEN